MGKENWRKRIEEKLAAIGETHGMTLELRRSMEWKSINLITSNEFTQLYDGVHIGENRTQLFAEKTYQRVFQLLETFSEGLNQKTQQLSYIIDPEKVKPDALRLALQNHIDKTMGQVAEDIDAGMIARDRAMEVIRRFENFLHIYQGSTVNLEREERIAEIEFDGQYEEVPVLYGSQYYELEDILTQYFLKEM